MPEIVTDYAVTYPWKAYKNGNNTFIITLTENGTAFDTTDYTFILNVRTPFGEVNRLQLTQGAGITNGGATGIITITLSQAQASVTLPRDYYFWELSYTFEGITYRMFSGGLTLSEDVNTSTSTAISRSISLAGTPINVAISVPGGDLVNATSVTNMKTKSVNQGQIVRIDGSQGGIFYYDANDASTTEDGGTVFVRDDGKRIKRIMDSPAINVKWFGAKGDAVYINKNVGANYGKAYKDSSFTELATDDSSAFESAIDFVMKNNASLLERAGSTNSGYRSQRYRLYIPKGAYYLTRSKIFSIRAALGLTGTQSGYIIQGDGVNNTYLVYNNTAGGAEDYLSYDNNSYPEVTFSGISFIGTTGAEKFICQKSTGNSQNYSLTDLSFSNYLEGYTVDGTGNADKTDFNRVKAYSTVANSVFFKVVNNTQSIAHYFKNCNITTYGKIFEIQSGGLLNISGGSYIVESGGTLYKINAPSPVGSYISDSNVTISTYSSKIEVHDNSVYIDANVSSVHINNEKTRFIDNTTDNAKIILRNRGRVKFSGCGFQDNPRIALVSDNSTYVRDTKPSVWFESCMLNAGYPFNNISYFQDDALTVPFAHSNTAGYGRVIVESCITNEATTNELNNGAPYANLGYYSYGYRKNVSFFRASPAAGRGLPNRTTPSASVTVPIHCVVCRVGIRKLASFQSGMQAAQTWYAKDGSGTTLATLTTSSANEVKTVFSSELWYDVSSETLQTITLESAAENSDHAAEGYLIVEYI